MIKVKVRTIWQGKVAVRDKYVDMAKALGQGMSITCRGGTMTIPSEELEARITGYSEKAFVDRFSDEKHRLAYFLWKPPQAQFTFEED